MVFKLQQILDEKNNIHSVSFISSWDEPTSWSSNFTTITYHQRTWWTYFDTQWIKDTTWQRRLRLLSHGRAYIHFNESSLRELDESRSCRSCDQFVGGSQIKYIIKNEELPKTVNFVYTGNVSRPSYDIPKEWLCCCLEYGFTQKDIACISQVSERTVPRRINQFELHNDCWRTQT